MRTDGDTGFDMDAFELEARGPSFARRHAEDAYLDVAFARDRAGRLTRLGGAAGASVLLVVTGCFLFPSRAIAIALVALVLTIAYGVTFVVERRSRRAYQRALLALNTTSGITFAFALNTLLELPVAGAVAMMASFLTTFPNTVVTPRKIVLTLMPGLALEIVLLWVSKVPRGDVALTSAALVIALALAFRIAIAQHRASRVAFRQERIIEAQKEAIARERAAREALLEGELRHQVAERSRELGVALARSDATFDVRRIAPGERFHGRYRVIAALGAGGMGAVYEVERQTDGVRLALKVVVGEVSGASAARFAREAEIGARVRHPNVVSIVDVGIASGVPFLAMELVRGGSLDSQRARFGDVAWAAPIVRQVAEGLAALHDAGVVHRDLKPANVLLADGGAKISDFGISRFGSLDGTPIDPEAATLDPSRGASSDLTGTGVVLGTPFYMAPESARGGKALGPAADVFALGIVAYEALTGRPPFAVPAAVLALAEQPITAPTFDDARVPDAARAVLLRCLSPDPTQRPTARDVAMAFA